MRTCQHASRAPSSSGGPRSSGASKAALDLIADGTAAAVFVAGESGVGKTRLLRELERRATARGVRVLRGDCLPFGADGLPYAPIAAALRGLARELEPDVFAELVGPAGGDLARLLPELSAARSADEPGEGMSATGEAIGQARLFGLLRALLDRLAEESPVLFAVEDIHWADRSTLEFLSSLVRGLRDERLLLVCTYRSDELHRRHPLRPFLAEEERRAVVERLEVGAFSQAELAEQVAGILGDAAGAGSRRAAARAQRGQRVLRRGAARGIGRRGRAAAVESARRPQPAARGTARRLARRAARGRRGRPALEPPPARGGGRAARAGAWSRPCARPWRSTCSSRTPTATRSATRCCRRPRTPTCSPASGPRCTSRSPRPCATTPAWPTGTAATELALHWRAGALHARGAGGVRARGARGRAGLRVRRGRAALRARAGDLGPRPRRRRALGARSGRGRHPRGAQHRTSPASTTAR